MTNAVLNAGAVLAIVLSASLPATAQPVPGTHAATLTVTGEASVTRAPDRAIVAFRIETNGDASANVTSQNQAIANALAKRLAGLNVPDADIATAGYALSFTPRPPKPDPASPQRYGYTVERTVNVTLDDPAAAGPAIDAGIAAGVTSVDGVTFTLRDARAALRSAQAAALADATAQARGLAVAANVRLTRIVSIAPGGGNVPAPRVFALAAQSVPTSIASGDLTVTATVTLRYEIAPE